MLGLVADLVPPLVGAGSDDSHLLRELVGPSQRLVLAQQRDKQVHGTRYATLTDSIGGNGAL